MSYIDLEFQGRPRVIATAVLTGPDGLAVVDPGPQSALAALEAGLSRFGASLADVRHVLLTHIHLDHAGATGAIVARAPQARVIVHERGARHMVDPTRLVASATRLYGDAMDRLWGPMLPVPEGAVQAVAGGETIECSGRRLEIAYTPGHASHHVSYFDRSAGVAYVGDTAGVRVAGDYLVAPTPPPDIDVETWDRSLDAIAAWTPVELFLTHFGPVSQAAAHLARFRDTLHTAAARVERSLTEAGEDADRIGRYAALMRQEAIEAVGEAHAGTLDLAAPFDQLWLGLARYWRQRAEAAGSPEASAR